MVASFIDRAKLSVWAGNGGRGCASVHREKFKPFGGPDGGNGGNGGNVIMQVDSGVHTLLDFHYRSQVHAENGKPGQGSHRHGATGQDLILKVPDGTVVHAADGTVLADLVGIDAEFVVAEGGRGGRGNASLANPRRRAPGFAELGEPGHRLDVVLELRSVADVGLVGFPSAGKSSLVAALSAARPKIADYPFTTLVPNLGVVRAADQTFTIADVPGLIPGAAQGKGLGLEFLRHVQRCAVLVHVVDCANIEPGRDPLADIEAIEHELQEYGGLADRPRLVALNKIDVPDAQDLADLVSADVAAKGWPVFEISAVTGAGLKQLSYALAGAVKAFREANPPPEPSRPVLRPKAVDDTPFTVVRVGEAFEVRGPRPERWVRQTDFSNGEAVGYLADRLARIGVEKALTDLGAEPGCLVRISEHEFEWEPAVYAGEDFIPDLRGADRRLDTPDRIGADERLAARKARRRPFEEAESTEDEPTET